MQWEPPHSPGSFAYSFQQGDEAALAFFYRQFYPALAYYANRWLSNRCLAEEIASDAFIKIWRHRAKLDSYNAIRAYLYKTVHRDCMRSLKRENRRTTIYDDAQSTLPTIDTPYDNLVRSEVCRLLYTALNELSSGSRQVLTMHFLDGKTTGEIAAELRLSPSTVKTQKIRGLQTLRRLLPHSLFLLFLLCLKIFCF